MDETMQKLVAELNAKNAALLKEKN